MRGRFLFILVLVCNRLESANCVSSAVVALRTEFLVISLARNIDIGSFSASTSDVKGPAFYRECLK